MENERVDEGPGRKQGSVAHYVQSNRDGSRSKIQQNTRADSTVLHRHSRRKSRASLLCTQKRNKAWVTARADAFIHLLY